jgi:hypothetical protein
VQCNLLFPPDGLVYDYKLDDGLTKIKDEDEAEEEDETKEVKVNYTLIKIQIKIKISCLSGPGHCWITHPMMKTKVTNISLYLAHWFVKCVRHLARLQSFSWGHF